MHLWELGPLQDNLGQVGEKIFDFLFAERTILDTCGQSSEKRCRPSVALNLLKSSFCRSESS